MTNTRPVPNIQSALVEVRQDGGKLKGYLVTPWNLWFQQFVQSAPAVQDVSITNPFTANQNGTLILTGATTINLVRGTTTINLNGQRIIPISIGDTVQWTGPATAQFLGA